MFKFSITLFFICFLQTPSILADNNGGTGCAVVSYKSFLKISFSSLNFHRHALY
jgi:hypothetical protein